MWRSAARRTRPFRGRGVSIGGCQVGPAPPRHGALGGRQVLVHASLPCVKVDQVETTRTLARDGHSMAHVRRVVSVAGVTTPEVVELVDPVAYPGFFGCPETPLHPRAGFFLSHGGDTLTGTNRQQPLKFATFGNPPETKSGYATETDLSVSPSMTTDGSQAADAFLFASLTALSASWPRRMAERCPE